jgi:hypothetical protein
MSSMSSQDNFLKGGTSAVYEVYCERFLIVEWRYGTVWKTQSLGCGWFDEDGVKKNRAEDTNVLYVAATDDFARNNSTMRKKKTTKPAIPPDNNRGMRQGPS